MLRAKAFKIDKGKVGRAKYTLKWYGVLFHMFQYAYIFFFIRTDSRFDHAYYEEQKIARLALEFEDWLKNTLWRATDFDHLENLEGA